MAALTRPMRPVARAAACGEGPALAALWRTLWDAHEQWGGYRGSHDARVYALLASRLDEDARVRGGHPILGRHVHLVADLGGVPCGQVEGWLEQHGASGSTPLTCEVRSLIVAERARHLGAGRVLLDALSEAARTMGHGLKCVMAAEVLEPNPAHAFYQRVGYSPVAWSARIGAAEGARLRAGRFSARVAAPGDALIIARLEATLAARRRAAGDTRFDGPRAIDATLVDYIASQVATDSGSSLQAPARIVVVDPAGVVRGAASFAVDALEPPFLPARRALVGRFALDAAFPAGPLVEPLVALGCRLAMWRGAMHVELTDLSEPGTDLYDGALATGAKAWSRVVTKKG